MTEKHTYEALAQDDFHAQTLHRRRMPPYHPIATFGILIILLVISLTGNIVQVWHASKTVTVPNLSKYANLSYNTNIDWKFNPGEKNSSQEELLEAISLNDGAIAVPKDWAAEKGLGETSIFPWDESKLVYFIHAYHGLHCVNLIYRFVKEVRDTGTHIVPLEHVIHCLDAMRKDIMCYADDTPRPRRYEANSTVAIKAEGELRQCRDWSVLESWAKERPACFQAGNADPGDMLHSQLRFCPEDSPYLPAVREYFGKDDD